MVSIKKISAGLIVTVLMLSGLTVSAQENNFSFGFNFEKNKNDESLGFNVTSPYIKKSLALRLAWNTHKFDYIPLDEVKIKQSDYHSFRLGITGRYPAITEVIYPYFNGGAIGVIPHSHFSDREFQAGVFLSIGFEAFSKNFRKMSWFAEGGMVSISDSKKERGVDSKEYAYMQFAFGTRFYLGK